jgi:hypothetical protein
VRTKAGGGDFKKYNSVTNTVDPSVYNMAEKATAGDGYMKVGEHNGWWLLRKFDGNSLLKYNPLNDSTDLSAFTNEEKLAVFEESVKKDFDIQVARDPSLAPGQLTDVAEPYEFLPLPLITVHIKGDPEEEFYVRQLTAVRSALTELSLKRVPLPDGLEIYISSVSAMQQAAYAMTGRNAIIMKPSMFNNPEQARTEEAAKPALPGT